MTDSPTGGSKTVARTAPQFNKVILTHPKLMGQTVFRSISETRARAWLEAHYPRGSEAYLQLTNGSTEHYEAERRGENGTDADRWQPFDPADWVPAEQQAPPGDSEWADKEG